MQIYRFYFPFKEDQKVIKIEDLNVIHQLKRVLRLKEKDKIVIFNNNLKEATAEIIKIAKNFVELEIKEIKENLREPKREVSLYCALLKRENFELIVQKATEVGVKEIVPLITKRTIKTNFKRERIEKIIKEASEQSGRGVLPKILKPINFNEALNLAKDKLNLFFHLEGENLSFLFNKLSKNNPFKIGVFIGPEGGWDEKEIELAKENNFIFISLSNLTFRAETAAIVATYLAVHL